MKMLMEYIYSTFNYILDCDSRNFADNARLQLLNKPEYIVYVNHVTIPGYEDNYEHYCKLTQKALNEWSAVIDNKIKFKVQNNLVGADIKVYWRKSKRSHAALQYREVVAWNYNGEPIKSMLAVNIGIIDLEGKPYSDENIYHLILHEFGHILTLGHSPDPHDVMCAGGDWNPNLTENDKFVLRLIYSFETWATYQECLPEIKFRVKRFKEAQKKEYDTKNNAIQIKKYIPQDLLNNLECIEDIVKYKMALQSVKLDNNTSKHFNRPEYISLNSQNID